jgi:hypothetical protein
MTQANLITSNLSKIRRLRFFRLLHGHTSIGTKERWSIGALIHCGLFHDVPAERDIYAQKGSDKR